MTVDTSEFAALAEQVTALNRKVSALSGRITAMDRRLNRVTGLIENSLGLLLRTVATLAGGSPSRQPGRHAAPGKRHLRLVATGQA